jgi:Skp family chaperone for outer membrane proteins
MRKHIAFLSAAALLLCSVATASAATAMHGTDTVILSSAQRSTVWNDLSKQATNQSAAGFDAAIGTFVPKSVKIEPMPSKLTASNPKLRPYGFAMVGHKLVIVDPTNRVIADVLKG